MTKVTRREFSLMAAGAVTAASSGLSRPALAAGPAKIVIIGGGPGGAAVANRLRTAAPDLAITLVEPKEKYTTCFYSNVYIGGFRSFRSITFDYEGVRKRGITVVTDAATAIDTTTKTVTLARGASPLSYDRLVVAPGIDIKFDSIEGYSPEAAKIMPHAWQGGEQTWILKEKLLALPDGGLVVMSSPPNPYRCPPGPYERACMIAHFLKTTKPKSKIILFDAKRYYSKQAVFEQAFMEFYKDIVEINLTNEIDDYSVVKVNPQTGEVTTKSGQTERAVVANIIPAQKAGSIAASAGLTEGDWCPINPQNFSSTKARDVYVIGDAAIAADMPKSAYAAVSQAGVVAADIIADLTGKPRTAGRYHNTCWSMVAPGDSAKIGGDYSPGEKNGKPFLKGENEFISQPDDSPAVRLETNQESQDWYQTVVADLFGETPQMAGP
ncbi:Flavocytochrome c sulphide dehydrogenase flavin-binding protein [Hyphomicrobium denitrificans ATCC 51888]|uniref:Flavocytochrome c sulphide dehydrogenase flavin-binding protein n=1 Tax=Hyphomicrobium denitrificans (strain ATCC 51888 / DSM 1869 / NCIMB 11706 / TK 0415) TaxID=582899 RepID=D8JX77_HYPDA|nr:NAD(P)/FAD-dependent oxidoreductase [Hyphomicrobium denitrificans]ADJ23213.1 Flavocytochrome c sulphide dehydrogenase flavin-binding protein [Hyphomicrobium denitrificans ATCC 51888]